MNDATAEVPRYMDTWVHWTLRKKHPTQPPKKWIQPSTANHATSNTTKPKPRWVQLLPKAHTKLHWGGMGERMQLHSGPPMSLSFPHSFRSVRARSSSATKGFLSGFVAAAAEMLQHISRQMERACLHDLHSPEPSHGLSTVSSARGGGNQLHGRVGRQCSNRAGREDAMLAYCRPAVS